MKHIFKLSLMFQLIFAYPANAQVLNGEVKDFSSGEPLMYVNIGVVDKNMGVISRDDGTFSIDLSKASKEDKLAFSMIGYETQFFSVPGLPNSRLDVRMKKKTYQLPEVVVSKKRSEVVKLGRHNPTKTTIGHSNTETFGFGGEWGLKIFNDGKKYWLEDVRFHLRFNTLDSVLFRVNIYNVRNDLPGESILREPLFVSSYRNDHWIIKDLSDLNFIITEDLIVTFEIVRIWVSDRRENQLFFTYGKGYERGKTYTRASSMDKWAIDQRPPATLYLSATEY